MILHILTFHPTVQAIFLLCLLGAAIGWFVHRESKRHYEFKEREDVRGKNHEWKKLTGVSDARSDATDLAVLPKRRRKHSDY